MQAKLVLKEIDDSDTAADGSYRAFSMFGFI
jgi:hypothetical protein